MGLHQRSVVTFQGPKSKFEHTPVVQVHSLPIRILPWIECTSIPVEFIAENEVVLLSIRSCAREHRARRVWINEFGHVGQIRYLACAIDTAVVEAHGCQTMPSIESQYRVSSEEHDKASDEDDESANIGPSSE